MFQTIRQPRRLQINPQIQSAFFTILNEDIRNLIYEYLFGCATLNVDSGWQERYCHASLLGICQRAYIEGIRVFYSTNVFKLSQDDGLDIWMDYTRVQRWDLIRNVDLRITLAADMWQWGKTWEILYSMPNLRIAKLRCETKMQFTKHPRRTCKVEDPFEGEGFFLPWALNPMLWPRRSNEVTFEILFNIERKKTLEILLEELRACEMRGIRIGWVSWTGSEEIRRTVEANGPLNLNVPEEFKLFKWITNARETAEPVIEWEEV